MDVDLELIDNLLDTALENQGKVTLPPPTVDTAALEKEKEKEREIMERDRTKERERDRERYKRSERDDERSRKHSRRSKSRSRSPRRRRHSHSRSRSPSDRRRSTGSDQRDRERERDRERRRREEDRRRQRDDESRLTPAEREAVEIERDGRTVFAFNIPLKADEDDIADFFSKAGKVRDIRLITDKNSRRSKGDSPFQMMRSTVLWHLFFGTL